MQKRTLELQQEGASKERIDAEIAQLTTLETARADFAAKDKAAEDALKLLDDDKAAIQDKVANGKLFQVQADQQIVDLYRQQLPALQQLATQLTANAKTEEEIVQAATLQKNIDKAKSATAIAGQQIASLKSTLEGSLTSGFTNRFANLTSGTKSVGDSFKTLAASVVSSLAQVAAQMLATLLIKKLLGSDEESGGGGGGGAGGLLGGLLGAFGGHAEGGLIKGPGGPKADAIPARLSAGEYIVKADAVSAFGVHNLEAINRGLKITVHRKSLSSEVLRGRPRGRHRRGRRFKHQPRHRSRRGSDFEASLEQGSGEHHRAAPCEQSEGRKQGSLPRRRMRASTRGLARHTGRHRRVIGDAPTPVPGILGSRRRSPPGGGHWRFFDGLCFSFSRWPNGGRESLKLRAHVEGLRVR